MKKEKKYSPKNKVRIVTAASLFDGHDAAINIMRRIIQATGCEVIHLGHDRSVEEVVNCAIQEDVNAIANPVLRHRVIPNFNAEAEGINIDDLIQQLIKDINV